METCKFKYDFHFFIVRVITVRGETLTIPATFKEEKTAIEVAKACRFCAVAEVKEMGGKVLSFRELHENEVEEAALERILENPELTDEDFDIRDGDAVR